MIHSTHIRRRIARFAFAALLMAVCTRASAAQEGGDATLGRPLAEQWCSGCHVVEPTAQQGSSNGAPTFAAIAGMNSTTSMSLHAFLQSSHPPMPDLRLSRSQIDNVVGYILSLRRTE
jgi:mono/diheme cytochrome c family protein